MPMNGQLELNQKKTRERREKDIELRWDQQALSAKPLKRQPKEGGCRGKKDQTQGEGQKLRHGVETTTFYTRGGSQKRTINGKKKCERGGKGSRGKNLFRQGKLRKKPPFGELQTKTARQKH